MISYLGNIRQRMQIFVIGLVLGAIVIAAGILRYGRQKEVKVETLKATVMQKLESVGNLETATMTLEKTLKGKEQLTDYLPTKQRDNSIQDFLFKDELIITLQAHIIAGYDLKKLTKDSLVVNDDASVTLILPEPVILHATLTDKTLPQERQTGIFTKGKVTLETEIRNSALESLKTEAIEKGLLQEAKKSAQILMQNLFGTLGITVREVKTQSRFD